MNARQRIIFPEWRIQCPDWDDCVEKVATKRSVGSSPGPRVIDVHAFNQRTVAQILDSASAARYPI
jgi:hypothetical protein